MRIVALVQTYNERRFIAGCIEHLREQGVETYLIDNESTDDTVGIAERYLGRGVIGIETLPRHGEFALRAQCERQEELAAELDADWFIHHDADEIRVSGTQGRSLAHTIEELDRAGFTAVDFHEYVFVPTRESPDHDHPEFRQTMRWYYPYAPASPFRRNAWKRQEGPVELAWSGGHVVRFPDLRPAPSPLALRHYLFLSVPHAIEKFVIRRFANDEVEAGWHGWRARLASGEIALPHAAELRVYTADHLLDPSDPWTKHVLAPAPVTREPKPADLSAAMRAVDGGADLAPFVDEAAAFVPNAPAELPDPAVTFLVRAADAAFTADRFGEARMLYDFLAGRALGGHGAKLRQAHVRILDGDAEGALRLLELLAADPEYGVNGDRLRALALIELERDAEAAEACRTVLAAVPDDVAFARLLLSTLVKLDDPAQLEALDSELAGLPPDLRLELLFRAHLTYDDYDGLRRLMDGSSLAESPPAARAAAETVRALMREGDQVGIDELLAVTRASPGDSAVLTSAVVGALIRRPDLARAGQWLDEAGVLLDGSQELQVARFRYLCHAVRLDEARAVLLEWEAAGNVPADANAFIGPLHSLLGEWDAIVDFVADRARYGVSVLEPATIEVVAAAARRTNRYTEILNAIDLTLAGEPSGPVRELRDRLGVEISLLRDLGSPGGLATGIDPGLAAIESSAYAARATRLSAILAPGPAAELTPGTPPGGEPGDATVLFCADRSYLAGVCVAVSSLLRHNREAAPRFRLLVVSEDDAAELAGDVLGALSHATGVPIETVRAETILPDGSDLRLRAAYGLFIAGHRLSDAAYYRVFATRRLIDEVAGGRALYLDSDTCLAPGLEEILALDLGGAPLAARRELPPHESPISAAARKLGLEPEDYFNSGVLLFDLAHPELAGLLDRAIEIAVEEHELLTFHDQCALNLAFRDRVATLDDAYNFYVRPRRPLELNGTQPIVWHFLEHYKPWNPLYTGENCNRWLDELEALGEIVGSERLRALLSIQFER